MDQIANWVRFADAKATILVAGLGVILTMLMTNGTNVITAAKRGTTQTLVISVLAVATVAVFGWTLYWLYQSLRVRDTTVKPGLNRFAWPTLTNINADALIKHGEDVDVRLDAWDQVASLARIADHKFAAQNHAVRGFVALILCGATLVGLSITINGIENNKAPAAPSRIDETEPSSPSKPTRTAKPTRAAPTAPPTDRSRR